MHYEFTDAHCLEHRDKKTSGQRSLPACLRDEKAAGYRGGIYQTVQIELTYNSSHMEGSRLNREQTRMMYETGRIASQKTLHVDEIVETASHFCCIDMVIDQANRPLCEKFIKELHRTLKNGTSDSRKAWFATGEYKKIPNEVGGRMTTRPEEVSGEMRKLLAAYHPSKQKTLEEIIAFHYEFETIHPFQDGNGRIGRLLLLKECLRCNIVPFIIDEDLKRYYYRGLQEWKRERGYLTDTCLAAQDKFKAYLDYFGIPYEV